MRETRNAQSSIFDFYSEHEHGVMLAKLSKLLDSHELIVDILKPDLVDKHCHQTGRCGLSVDSILRCLLLKSILQVSYKKLAFYLSDSATYRTFARLSPKQNPSKSGLQSTIRKVQPQTLQQIHEYLCIDWHQEGLIETDKVRIDSTVVEANISTPSDSGLLNDSIRVLSRELAVCHRKTGMKVRIVDQREKAKKLRFSIFYAKNTEKQVLYPKLLRCAYIVLKQVDRALERLDEHNKSNTSTTQKWIEHCHHHRDLLSRVVHQTQQRVYEGCSVASSEKVVSVFESHADIIVKGAQDVQYGHKINLATQTDGIIVHLEILNGNPSDKLLYQPVLDSHRKQFGELPKTTIADGGYASVENAKNARAGGGVFKRRFTNALG